MEQREVKIVDAAFRVFSRYGVKRTTMNDIAEEAGLVRQTLYTVYKNKDSRVTIQDSGFIFLARWLICKR